MFGFKKEYLNYKLTNFIKKYEMFQMERRSEDLLDLYKDIVKCYEQLRLTYNALNAEQILDLEHCYTKIDALLNLELEVAEQSDLNFEICASLLLVRNGLIQLMNNPIKSKDDASNDTTQAVDNTDVIKKKPIHVTIPGVKGFDEIAGLDEIKKILITIIVLPLHQPQLYLHRKLCNSILFYGPPGTGKTRLAHAVAAEASATFFSLNCSDILSHYVGKTEKAIKQVFDSVKEQQKCTVLFMDEIDGLCQRRQANENESTRRFKTELMCQLSSLEDCSNKYLICATNCPWDLDTAIIRRFQRRIHIPLPSREERFELIRYLTKDISIEISAEVFSLIVDKTEGYSGSDITDVIRNAMNMPIHELSNTQVWEFIGDNKYKPAGHCPNTHKLTVSNILQMPPGSVQVRPVEVFDIMKALEIIKPTVPICELIKYEKFSNISYY